MIVVPSEVFYQPKFTYIWTLGVGRFPAPLRRRVSRDTALREIARCFLSGAGMTIPGEMARVTGLPRPEAGRGNRALVAEGYAIMQANQANIRTGITPSLMRTVQRSLVFTSMNSRLSLFWATSVFPSSMSSSAT